jgi:hypothetical protein
MSSVDVVCQMVVVTHIGSAGCEAPESGSENIANRSWRYPEQVLPLDEISRIVDTHYLRWRPLRASS